MYGDPEPDQRSAAADAALRILDARIHEVAAAGGLRVDEQLAVDMVHAAGCGTVLALLAHPAERRDPRLSDAIFEAVIAAIATGSDDRHGAGPVPAATPSEPICQT